MPKIGSGKAYDGSIFGPIASAFGCCCVGRSLMTRFSPSFTK